MLTDKEKQIIVNLLSQVTFKVGESQVAREIEEIIKKLKTIDISEKSDISK